MKNTKFSAFLIFILIISLITVLTATAQNTLETKKGSPIVLMNETLFYVYDRIGPFKSEDRTNAITARLSKIIKDPLAETSNITTSEGETTTDIFIGDVVIMSVTDGDAKTIGQTRQALADAYAQDIRNAIERIREETSPKSIIIAFVIALATATALILVFGFIHKALRIQYAKLRQNIRFRPLKIHEFEVLSAERITDAIIISIRGLYLILLLISIYFYVPFILNLFPWTKGTAGKLISYILSGISFLWAALVSHLPDIVIIVIVAFLAHYAIKIARLIFNEIEKGSIKPPRFYKEWAQPTYKLVRLAIIILAIIVVYQYIPGSDSPVFKGITIFLGVLFSLGSTSAMANVIAGIIIIYMRAFNLGDRIKIGDTMGDVTYRSVLVTRIRTIKNVEITVPNSMILSSHVLNYSASNRQGIALILHTTVTIGYDVPWRKVHELLIDSARSTQHILDNPEPFVLQKSLDDFYVSYELNAYTDEPSIMAKIYSELHQNIQDRFHEADIEIISVHYHAIRDGSQLAVPPEYLPDGYTPQAFKVVSVNQSNEKKKD